MNKYEVRNSCESINLYYEGSKDPKAEFARAKQELIDHIERDIQNLKNTSFNDFKAFKGSRWRSNNV